MMRTGTENAISDNMVPPCNWALWKTSSWGNYFLGRDHLGGQLEMTQPEQERRDG